MNARRRSRPRVEGKLWASDSAHDEEISPYEKHLLQAQKSASFALIFGVIGAGIIPFICVLAIFKIPLIPPIGIIIGLGLLFSISSFIFATSSLRYRLPKGVRAKAVAAIFLFFFSLILQTVAIILWAVLPEVH